MPTRTNLCSFIVLAVCQIAFFSLAYSQLDPTFGAGGTTVAVTAGEDRPIGSFLLPDGKILVVDGRNDASQYQFLRFNADGSPDVAYGTNGQVTLSFPSIAQPGVRKAIRQADGKIVLAGNFNSDGLIARFNEDGTIDPTFSEDGVHRPNINQNGVDGITDVIEQPDGKLLAIGDFPFNQFFAIRYDANGEVDAAFGDHGGYMVHDGGPGFYAPSSALQTSGKLLIISAPTTSGIEPPPGKRAYRLNPDGTVDSSFEEVYTPRNTNVIRVLDGDKFILAGYETNTDNLLRTNTDISVRRYEPDGQSDLTFGTAGHVSIDVTSHFPDEVVDVAEQPDGKIVIGARTRVPTNRSSLEGFQLSLVQLSTDGSGDGKYLVTRSEIVIGYGHVLLQPDGKIVTVTTRKDPSSGFESDVLLTRSLGVPSLVYRFHGIPFQLRPDPQSFGQSGHADAAVFRPGNGRWYTTPGTIDSILFGLPDDILVPSDYLGYDSEIFTPLNSEVAVFRPSSGTWYIGKDAYDPAHNFIAVQWGANGDIPAPADYDGDGKSDLAVFRPSSGIWYIKNIGDDSSWALQWGLDGDTPVVGDYDGDGIYDIAVWRPGNGFWYIVRSSDGQIDYVQFGSTGDIPVQEDFDGDGKFDIAVWRPSNGLWYILRSSDGGITYHQWGLSDDVACPADYDGDHITDIAVWRPSTRMWYINYSSGRPVDPFVFGAPGDIPVPGRSLVQP